MADLEANMMHLQLLHESLNRFNECFGAFLYGMNMSAFCVDFPEAPGIESFKRAAEAAKNQAQQDHAMSADVHHRERDVDATFLYIITILSHHISNANSRSTVRPTPVS
jgi:DASH complex subunit DAM1